jgi:hypothetical protein
VFWITPLNRKVGIFLIIKPKKWNIYDSWIEKMEYEQRDTVKYEFEYNNERKG